MRILWMLAAPVLAVVVAAAAVSAAEPAEKTAEDAVKAYLEAQGKGDIKAGFDLAVGSLAKVTPLAFAHVAATGIKYEKITVEKKAELKNGFHFSVATIEAKRGEQARQLKILFAARKINDAWKLTFATDEIGEDPDAKSYEDLTEPDVKAGVAEFEAQRDKLKKIMEK